MLWALEQSRVPAETAQRFWYTFDVVGGDEVRLIT
jgi:hypothetical protein